MNAPRERLERDGVGALSDAELLALILRHGRQGQSAIEVATRTLVAVGGLGLLASIRLEELSAVSGLGLAKSAAVIAAFELGRRSALTHAAPRIERTEDIALIARAHLGGLRRERVIVLVCDAANQLRQTITVSDGAADTALFPIREILNAVLRNDGRAFAVAHNHPSGDVRPSTADKRATRALENAANTVGLRFIDHVVVTNADWRKVG